VADRGDQARQAALGRAQGLCPGYDPGIRELMVRRLAGDVRIPAKSTVHAVPDRHGLVARARRRRNRAEGTPLSLAAAPNDLWCTDFKGEFRLGNGRTCYPLTVTDQASRYVLACEALDSTREEPVIEAFQRLFAEGGLPRAMRSDNGLPFASANGLYDLSKLSVWWLRLGLRLERIKPGQPHQNGRHERMHLTLKTETTRPPRRKQPAAAGQVRCLHERIQRRKAPRGSRHTLPGRRLRALTKALCRPAGTRLSLPTTGTSW
jgi:transposase InsO family protein